MPDMLYLNGEWVASGGTGVCEVVNAATEEVIGTVPDGVPADVDAAVAAAVDAFDAWAATPVAERARLLRAIAAGLRDRADELTDVITAEVGMARSISGPVQVASPIGTFDRFADLAEQFAFAESPDAASWSVVREPIGVVAAITPWNYPLNQVAAKVAGALAAGCTVVLKPSEVAPLSAWILCEVADAVGLPPGVLNLVSGVGAVVGEALVSHPDVAMISFTGSTRAGRRISELAAGSIKRVALELGGKSPFVILDDVDGELLGKVVKLGVAKAYLNSGQTCSAFTRMIVPEDRLDEVEALAAAAAEKMTVGDPFDASTRLGPLVSAVQRDRVRSYIRLGVEEGAKLLTGGDTAPDGLETGYFVRPTVFSRTTPDMRIVREEIFGPVLVIQTAANTDDAVRLANDTDYGLAAGVYGADPERARQIAGRLRAGQVEINGGRFDPFAPFGGYKQSGNGREYGHWGLEEFLEVKALLS